MLNKVPLEHIYLETSAIPIPYILSTRRLIYLQVLLKRSDTELTKRIYKCQKENPSPGDWCQLITADFETIGEHMEDDHIANMPVNKYKNLIKNKIRKAAFNNLQDMKRGHSKVKNNNYENLDKPQPYLISKLFTNDECSILFALRSKTIRGIRENFKHMYSDNTLCPICERTSDTQQHVLECKVLQDILPLKNHIKYNHINGTISEQKEFVTTYAKYLEIRDELLSETESQQSLPGLYTGPQHPQARTKRTKARRSSGDIVNIINVSS